MSNLLANHTQMLQVWNSFQATWAATRESWKDIDRDRFERENIQELSNVTSVYLTNLRRLAETIQQIRRDAP